MAKTPLMDQYRKIKENYPDALLFFRLGDFYEMFFDDAVTASRELELTLTGRNAGMEERAPMCGVPYHAAETYIYRLIQKGYRVAICEQMEDPKKAKGLVRREVIRVITPGTILFENAIADKSNNYLVYIVEGDKQLGAVMADISTGECWWGLWDARKEADDFFDMLSVYSPAEAVCAVSDSWYSRIEPYCAARLGACLLTRRDAEDLRQEPVPPEAADSPEGPVQLAFAGLAAYLREVMKADAPMIHVAAPLREDHTLTLAEDCLRNLEITKNMRDGGRKGTLLEVLDYTNTAMGARLLKRWLERPLTDVNAIVMRQDAVEELTLHATELEKLEKLLGRIFDFERILSRIEANTTSPKDLLALKASLDVVPQIKDLLGGASSLLLSKLNRQMGIHGEVYDLLDRAMDENGTGNVRDGRYIRSGYNSELDELRSLSENSRKWIADLEEKEKEKTGIKMKIGFNNVFGYYFEISHANKIPVPAYFTRKQTLANAERYITPELKEFEVKALSAKEKTEELELRIYQEVKNAIRPAIADMQKTARALAAADCLASLARAALKDRYVRPAITRDDQIIIRDGRHPMVEHALKREMFVPNDTTLNHSDQEILIITGPNMAGKSTYMRQVAVLTIMAQTGSFIPAKSASFTPVDRVFTRVGATDDISTGQSTFMVEMQEVSQILKSATKNSLILLDEIGRGTSTYDGMSIARAVVEYIDSKIHAYTLFATHYHELADMESASPHIKNYTVTVKERGKDITFLRRIVPGSADRSYGIHVARLAGLPEPLLKRSEEILKTLEEKDGAPKPAPAKQPAGSGGDLFAAPILDELRNLDVMSKTPIEAMEILFRLSQEAKESQ